MFNDNPIIIACSGNSIPFDNQRGIDTRLKTVIENNITIGCNYFDYHGCSTTFLTFVDASDSSNFYKKNLEWLKNIPLIIGRDSSLLEKIKFENTILLPAARYYHGKEGLNIKYLKCENCKKLFDIKSKLTNCPKCKCQIWNIGIFPNHLVSMFSLSLAIALGFKDIFLLGCDCCEINGKTHFYEDILKPEEVGSTKKYKGIGKKFWTNTKSWVYRTGAYNDLDVLNNQDNRFGAFKDYKKDGLNIYNVSTKSRLSVFPKIGYDEFYKMIGNQSLNQENIRKEIKQYILDKCH